MQIILKENKIQLLLTVFLQIKRRECLSFIKSDYRLNGEGPIKRSFYVI